MGTPSRTPQRTPAEDGASQTPKTETSYRRREDDRTPRSQRSEAESSRMVHSQTDPNLNDDKNEKKFKSFRDDPRYRDTGKEYGPWPPYPEWQDMPLRRFGN